MAKADQKQSNLVHMQVKMQEHLRPATWLWPIKRLHATRQLWKIEHSDTKEVIRKLVDMSNDLGEDFNCWVHRHNTVYVNYLTPAKWLDQVIFTFKEEGEIIHIMADCASTGLLPMNIPLAPVLNTLLFFAPFCDGGKTLETLDVIREGLQQEFVDKTIEVEMRRV